MTAKCSNCPFWESAPLTDPEGGYHPDDGWCHHVSNAAKPEMNSTGWWCSAHPLHPGRVHELAAMAMQGMLACETGEEQYTPESLSLRAYRYARAMLAEAEKGEVNERRLAGPRRRS